MVTSPQQKEASEKWDQRLDTVPEPAGVDPEISKVLQVKRWEEQRGPFRGFNSPPGRF